MDAKEKLVIPSVTRAGSERRDVRTALKLHLGKMVLSLTWGSFASLAARF